MQINQVSKTLIVLVFSSVSLWSCLKSRLQLKEDPEDTFAPRPVAIHPGDTLQQQKRYLLDEIREEMTRMAGRLEDLERSQKEWIQHTQRHDANSLSHMQSRLQFLETQFSKLQENVHGLKITLDQKNPEEQLKLAKAQLLEKDYLSSIENLKQYIKNPKSKFLEESIFLLAESYFYSKQYKKSIAEYSKIVEKYSKSSLMPKVLYKIALAFDALGLKEDAHGFYQELIVKYPRAPEAKLSRKK